MRDTDGAWKRPRGQAWGNDAQRAVLHALAEDIARRSAHRVAALEVLRSDGNLEFVAIAGDPEARAQLVGQASPLALDRVLGPGLPLAGWVHVPVERLDDFSRAWLTHYGHTPDLPRSEDPLAWDPEDQLVRLLRNDQGELRALLYLDEPLDGMRPTEAGMKAVNEEIEALCDAIVGIVERELYGEEVRMVTQVRTAIQNVRLGASVPDFLRDLGEEMVRAMAVDTVDVLLAGDESPALAGEQEHLEEQMRRVWLRRAHVVLEPDVAWGVTEVVVPTPPVMARLMEERGLGSWLLMPIGMGEEYLGTIGFGRVVDGPRWTDSEINAARAVATDLAGVVLGARILARERTLNAELRGLNDYRRDMMQTLAHELRNPVSVLFTHLELLAMEEHTEDARDSLAALQRATLRIEDMVEDLLGLASVSDPERGELTEVDVPALVRDSADFLASTAAADGVSIRVDEAPGRLVVLAEEAGVQRLVTNLLSNAVKYTPAGGEVSVRVESSTVEDHDGVLLTCTDTGIGIDASEVDRVFEPFYRSGRSEARRRPGTGLGLAIVERVVSRQGGTISVDSVLGQGTTFRAWLPHQPPAGAR